MKERESECEFWPEAWMSSGGGLDSVSSGVSVCRAEHGGCQCLRDDEVVAVRVAERVGDAIATRRWIGGFGVPAGCGTALELVDVHQEGYSNI